jgi:hypothetical protein
MSHMKFNGSYGRTLTPLKPRHLEIPQSTLPLNDLPAATIPVLSQRPIAATLCRSWHWLRSLQKGGKLRGRYGLDALLRRKAVMH